MVQQLLCWIGGVFGHPSAPAWGQAIASGVGIAVAIYLARLPFKHGAKVKRQTALAIAEAAHIYAGEIREALNSTEGEPSGLSAIYSVYSKSTMGGLLRAIQQVPVHEFQSSHAVRSFLSFTQQLALLDSCLEQILLGPHKHPNMAAAFESVLQDDKERLKLTAVFYSTMKGNAARHLNQIDTDYEAIKAELKN